MAISIDDIKKLRAMTGAGLADVKKALTEADDKPRRQARKPRKAAAEDTLVVEEATPAEEEVKSEE